MRANVVLVAATAAALCAGSNTQAAYLGVGLRMHTAVSINGALRNVIRVYAVFDEDDDFLVAIAGSGRLGPMKFQTLNSTLSGPGGNFVNPVGGGSTAPSVDLVKALPDVEWDTFATIGMAINDGTDGTGMSPGFDQQFGGQFIIGNSATVASAAWFTKGPQEQGRAGGPYAVEGAFSGSGQSPTGLISGKGVLFAQLTINAGNKLGGTIAVVVDNGAGIAGGTVIADQTFYYVPGMPVTGILAAGFVLRSRRVRRSEVI
jgi:hypothetical protein